MPMVKDICRPGWARGEVGGGKVAVPRGEDFRQRWDSQARAGRGRGEIASKVSPCGRGERVGQEVRWGVR